MTKKEILEKYGMPSTIGICELCMYKNTCKDILKDFNKPKDCDGPYDRYADQW